MSDGFIGLEWVMSDGCGFIGLEWVMSDGCGFIGLEWVMSDGCGFIGLEWGHWFDLTAPACIRVADNTVLYRDDSEVSST
ncbi:unnamed protein product [Larinioides sclopetarius]|uniref:Uncharacterized protein n=1 Tax=Larinioides sclopetarius TaxID=280406 RepID=A0AAV1ZH37_9ARAC